MFQVLVYVISDSGKYSGFGYPNIRIPVEITSYKIGENTFGIMVKF